MDKRTMSEGCDKGNQKEKMAMVRTHTNKRRIDGQKEKDKEIADMSRPKGKLFSRWCDEIKSI